MKRIDRIDLTLDVAEEFEGRSTVTFSVTPTDQDDPFVLAVRAAWQAWYETLLAKAGDEPVRIGELL